MIFRSILLAGSLVLGCLVSPAGAEPRAVGVMGFSFDAPHRERLVQSLLFYPAEAGGMPEWVGDNAVFRGIPLRRDAKPERAKHPLVVVSHGSGGSAANLTWLASRLAGAGFVVAVPNHQGSTSGDSKPETTIPAIWERPADISRLLDAIAASPAVGALVDGSNITALGFSLGGATMLTLAGAELRAGRLAQFCDENPETIGCPWLAKGNLLIPGHVDLHRIDSERFNAAYPDPRIKRFVAIDPAFVPALEIETIKRISAPVQIINLGSAETFPTGLNAEHIAGAISSSEYQTVTGANHFDFLGECKRLGWFYIWMEGDDPVCTEEGSRTRGEIHDEIAGKVLAFLRR